MQGEKWMKAWQDQNWGNGFLSTSWQVVGLTHSKLLRGYKFSATSVFAGVLFQGHRALINDIRSPLAETFGDPCSRGQSIVQEADDSEAICPDVVLFDQWQHVPTLTPSCPHSFSYCPPDLPTCKQSQGDQHATRSHTLLQKE